jgi:hypothetical protein
VDPTLPLPAEKIQWIQEQMVKAGRLKAPLDLKTVTAPEYREKALKVIGHGLQKISHSGAGRRPEPGIPIHGQS